MKPLDLTQLKAAVTAARQPARDDARVRHAERVEQAKNRRALAGALRASLVKAGVDLGTLDQALAHNQSELHHAIEQNKTDAAKRASAAQSALQHGLDSRRKALQALGAPFTSSLITLDKPFLIWETPHPNLDTFIDQHVESGNSWIKIKVDTNSGSDNTSFNFYFLWQNDTDAFALVNVASSLVVTGYCDVGAAAGFFSGDSSFLSMTASLSLWEWWNQPYTQPVAQQSQTRSVVELAANGGSILDGAVWKTQTFYGAPFDLSYSQFAVPPKSAAIFEVTLNVEYGFPVGGMDTADEVRLNFADGGHMVLCPSVQLELLTAPATIAAAGSSHAAKI